MMPKKIIILFEFNTSLGRIERRFVKCHKNFICKIIDFKYLHNI